MSDDDWITEDMDDYFLGSEVEEECVDPEGYSYVDPETGLTPKQQAYLAYKQEQYFYKILSQSLDFSKIIRILQHIT